jgi:hypothetical protein
MKFAGCLADQTTTKFGSYPIHIEWDMSGWDTYIHVYCGSPSRTVMALTMLSLADVLNIGSN